MVTAAARAFDGLAIILEVLEHLAAGQNVGQGLATDVAQRQGDTDARLDVAFGRHQAGKLVAHASISHQRRLDLPRPAEQAMVQVGNGAEKPLQLGRRHVKPFVEAGVGLGRDDFKIGDDALFAQPLP